MSSSQQSGQPLKHRSVVSCFIFKADTTNSPPQVALFKRSAKVRTYQHHLAPISGTIDDSDANPLAAAWREIKEETTLTPTSLDLWRHGPSYSFSDLSIGRAWTIYPFAFRLRSAEAEKRITIDWEHDSWAWYDPYAVTDAPDRAFGGVPRLTESLRRAWFERHLGAEAGRVLEKSLIDMRTDYESGARELALRAVGMLKDVVQAMGVGWQEETWLAAVRFAAWHLCKNGRESMGAAVKNTLLQALQNVAGTCGSSTTVVDQTRLASAMDALSKFIQAQSLLAEDVGKQLVYYCREVLASKTEQSTGLNILTLSDSSTIRHALIYLASLHRTGGTQQPIPFNLRVLESRPLFEGVSLAAAIAKEASPGVSVEIFTDASVALASGGVDIVLIGADRISEDGDVSNKTGTVSAILCANYVTKEQAKVVVLSDTYKIAPGKAKDHIVENNDPQQVTRAWTIESNGERVKVAARDLLAVEIRDGSPNDGIRVQNTSFEWCSRELIDVYLTDKGQWGSEQIIQYLADLKNREEVEFGFLKGGDLGTGFSSDP